MFGTSRLLFLLLVCISSCLAIEILSPEDLKNTVINSPRLRWVGPNDWTFDVTGQLVTYENATDVANKIVLVGRYEYADIEDLLRRNALGAAVYADSSPENIPGLENYVLGTPQFDVKLPTVAISIIALEQLRQWIDVEGRNITARITSNDVDEWALMMDSGAMIFYSVFMSAFTLTCIVLATYKLIMFVQVKGCRESIPQTILIFEIVANVIRFFPSAIDPLQSRVVLPYAVSQMFFTTSWPFVIINLLLISFYWHELMSKTSMKINSFLAKLRIPFWIIFAVILALELTASFIRGLGSDLKVFLYVMGVCYIVVGLACVIFYIITGTKLTRQLHKMTAKVANSNRTKRLNRTSRHIYASAGGVIVWLIAIVIGGLTDTFWLPWGYFSVWFAGFFAITFISLMQILAIHEPRSVCGQFKTSTDGTSLTKSNARGTGSSLHSPLSSPHQSARD